MIMNRHFITWQTSKALNKIVDLADIESLYIATAFIEQEGVDWIKVVVNKHSIPKERIHVYLSMGFSSNEPANLLRQLTEIASVYIVHKGMLHAKTILALSRCGKGRVMFGSANLTGAGMNQNIELSGVIDVHAGTDDYNILSFFQYLNNMSALVTENVISGYKQKEDVLKDIQKLQTNVEQVLFPLFAEKDGLPHPSILKEYYFTYEDYEIFFERNARRVTEELTERRKMVSKKLRNIHDKIRDFANSLDLYSHKDDYHITTLMEPSKYNDYRLNWMGVRFGKHQDKIKSLLRYSKTDTNYSFPKHGCFQYSISDTGFHVGFFHAVKHNAWDRAFMFQKLRENPRYIDEIIAILKNLKGHGFVWRIHNPNMNIDKANFMLDSEEIDQFPTFYHQDEDGFESFLMKTFKYDDPAIKTEESIVELIRQYMLLLHPLYMKMVQLNF